MATLSQIRSLLRQKISQTDTGNTDFTDSELNGFINQSQRELGAHVKKPIAHFQVQVQQDYPAYTLPTNAILLATAYFGDLSIQGDVRPLMIMTEEALKEINPQWLDAHVSSQGRPYRIILLDRTTVVVNPRPDAAESQSGKKIHIGYVYQPVDLSADSDIPDIPLVYHDLLADYAYQFCLFSKLKDPVLGQAILANILAKAKNYAPLIEKESVSFGFAWGHSIDPNDDGSWNINP